MGILALGVMETSREQDPSSDDGVAGDPETTLADEEWPVSELYRVSPDEAAALESADAGERTVLLERTPDEAPARRRRFPFPPDLGPGLLLAVLAALLLVPAGIWLASYVLDDSSASPAVAGPMTPTDTTPSNPQPTVPAAPAVVPHVVGLTVAEARAALREAGLRTRVERVESEDPPDEVLRQSPAAGAELPDGKVVLLTVSRAPDGVAVPDVVGVKAGEATRLLREAGLVPRVRLVRSTDPAGTVLDQNPLAGETVEPDAVVVLEVAKAPPKPVLVAVPDLVGLSSAEAQRRLRRLGLESSVNRVEASDPAGTVVRQSPRAGAELRKGGTVTIAVSTGPAPVVVPDVVGLDERTARQELEAAGFEVRIVDEATSDPAEDGTVSAQTPVGGSTAPRGTVVTVTVRRLG